MATATFAYNNVNAFVFGNVSTGTYQSHPFAGIGSGGWIYTAFVGTQLEIQTIDGFGNYTVTIDGGAPQTVTPSAGWTWTTVATGLSDTVHTVKVSANIFEGTSTFRVTGASPALQKPTGYGTLVKIGSGTFPTNSAFDGPYTVGINGGFESVLTFAGNGVIRFRAAVTGMKLLLNGVMQRVALLRDGVEVYNAVQNFGNSYAIIDLFSGGDGLAHDYELINCHFNASYYYALVFDGGTGLVSQTLTPKPWWAFFGDSITVFTGLAAPIDTRLGDGYPFSRALNAVDVERGSSGTTVSWGAANFASFFGGMSPAPARVYLRHSVNDHANATPIATFKSDYTNYIQTVRTTYPNAKVVCTSTFPYTGQNTNGLGLSVAAYRTAIQEVVAAANSPKVIYMSVGQSITPTASVDTSDGIHVNASGFAKIATDEIAFARAELKGSVTGPSTGTANTVSSAFTYTLAEAATGTQTFTIGAGSGTLTVTAAGGTVSAPGSTVTVTPAIGATSFTFTYTPTSAGLKTITYTNGQGWDNPPSTSFTAAPDTVPMPTNIASTSYPTVAVSGVTLGTVSQIDETTYKYTNVQSVVGPKTVTLSTTYSNSEIRYTLNGKNPNNKSHLYTGPITVSKNLSGSDNTVIKARAYDTTNANVKSKIIRLEFRVR